MWDVALLCGAVVFFPLAGLTDAVTHHEKNNPLCKITFFKWVNKTESDR